ncbi:MAG: hypothetical protein B6D39_09155, partial [Anaerolineae bacterium UTCFX2]
TKSGTVTVLGDGQTKTNVIEFVPPDRKHIISPDENVEYIVIGEKVYANSSGEWEETQIPASAFLGDGLADAQAIGETISLGEFIRQDQFEGADVLIYSYASRTRSGDTELHSQTELWVSVEEGLPMKMVVDGEILSASTDPATGESKLQPVNALTTTIIIFDPTIRIEPPAVPTPVSLNLEEWVRTTQPEQALIQSIEAPYLKALGLDAESVSVESRIIQGANGSFAVVMDNNTGTPLLISGQNAQDQWTWQEATPGNIGALRWGMNVGINYGNALFPGVREKAAKFNMQFVSYDMTWALTEPTQGHMVFQNDAGYAYPDREIQYGFDHGQTVMAGQLIANEQFPEWLTNGINEDLFSPDQVREFVRNRITSMMQRYGDKVPIWIVLNEYHPIEWGWEPDPLQKSLGDYTKLVFEVARQVDPKATLLYNDCGNETPDLGSYQHNLDLAKTLHDGGFMDAMGIQMHLLRFKDHIPTYDELLNTFNAYRQIGVPVYITEMDVNMQNITGSEAELKLVGIDPASLPAGADSHTKRMLIQAQIYKDAIRAALDSQNVVSITFFTIGDNFSWLNQVAGPDSDGTLFNDQLEPKPAYFAVLQALLGQ